MKFAKKSDFIALAVLLLVCAGAWFGYRQYFGRQGTAAEIYYQSKLVETVDLTRGVEKRFSIPQNKNVVFHLYRDGSICFEESDCPDKICIRAGRLRAVGESAACLPNQIVLKIVAKGSGGADDIDMVAG
jgi:hypothetical protein